MVSGVKTDCPMFSRQDFHAYNGTNIELLNTMMVYNQIFFLEICV